MKTWLNCDTLPGKNSYIHSNCASRDEIQDLVNRIKLEKWKAQGNKCANQECPMDSSLKKGLEDIRASAGTRFGTTNTIKTPEDWFLRFYTQFEHTDATQKSFHLSAAHTLDKREEEVRKEAEKCTIHCNFCARLKTMESNDCQDWVITDEDDF